MWASFKNGGEKRTLPAIKETDSFLFGILLLYWWITSVFDGEEVCLISSWFGFSLASWQIRICPRQLYSRHTCMILSEFIVMHVKFLYHLQTYTVELKRKKNNLPFELLFSSLHWGKPAKIYDLAVLPPLFLFC